MTHLTFFILSSDTQYIRSGKMHAYVFPTQKEQTSRYLQDEVLFIQFKDLIPQIRRKPLGDTSQV